MDFKVGDKVKIKPIKMFGKTFYQVGYLVIISVQGNTIQVCSESTGEKMSIQSDKLERIE